MEKTDPVPIIVVGEFLDEGYLYAFEEGSERMMRLELKCRQGDTPLSIVRNKRFRVCMDRSGAIASWRELPENAQQEVTA